MNRENKTHKDLIKLQFVFNFTIPTTSDEQLCQLRKNVLNHFVSNRKTVFDF